MANRLEIAATTAAVATQIPVVCYDMDKVIFATSNNALATTETFSFWITNSSGGWTPVYNAAGTQQQLTASIQSVELEGGMLYGVTKSTTAAAVGLDSNSKSRQM